MQKGSIQARQQCRAIAIELGLAHTADPSQLLQGAGPAGHHLHQGAVVKHHVGRHPLQPRLLAAPILQRLQHGRLIRLQLCRSRRQAHAWLAAALALRWRQPQQ